MRGTGLATIMGDQFQPVSSKSNNADLEKVMYDVKSRNTKRLKLPDYSRVLPALVTQAEAKSFSELMQESLGKLHVYMHLHGYMPAQATFLMSVERFRLSPADRRHQVAKAIVEDYMSTIAEIYSAELPRVLIAHKKAPHAHGKRSAHVVGGSTNPRKAAKEAMVQSAKALVEQTMQALEQPTVPTNLFNAMVEEAVVGVEDFFDDFRMSQYLRDYCCACEAENKRLSEVVQPLHPLT